MTSNIGTVPSNCTAIYNFALRPLDIWSSVEFHDTLRTCELGAAKYGE